MTLNELILELEKLRKEHDGNIKVVVLSLSHAWAPEPEVRGKGADKVVVLNP